MKAMVFTVLLVLGVLVAPFAPSAQPPTKMHRVGLLHSGSPPPQILAGFRQGLRDLGYVEGQNLVIELRAAEGSAERLRDGATELVQLPVDVLVGVGTAAIRVAQPRPSGGQHHRLQSPDDGAAWQGAGTPQGDGTAERACRCVRKSSGPHL